MNSAPIRYVCPKCIVSSSMTTCAFCGNTTVKGIMPASAYEGISLKDLDWKFYDDIDEAWNDFLQGKRINVIASELSNTFGKMVHKWAISQDGKPEMSEGTTVDGEHVCSWWLV